MESQGLTAIRPLPLYPATGGSSQLIMEPEPVRESETWMYNENLSFYHHLGMLMPVALEAAAIDKVKLRAHCPLDNGQHDSIDAQQRLMWSECGPLDVLPIEIRQKILRYLDLKSLTRFRSVSYKTRAMTECLPEYDTLIHHGRGLVRASLSIGAAEWVSAADLCKALAEKRCIICSELAPFIYLLAAIRVCQRCVAVNERFHMKIPGHTVVDYGLTKSIVKRLPRILSLPGRYSMKNRRRSKRVWLVDPDAARQAGIQRYGSEELMQEMVSKHIADRADDYEDRMIRYDLGEFNIHTRPIRPIHFGYEDSHNKNPHRYMGVVYQHFYDRQVGLEEAGVSCKRCSDGLTHPGETKWRMDPARLYSLPEFIDHLGLPF